jgi:uncharacterized protein
LNHGPAAALYPSLVMHRRLVAPLYRFVYRVFYIVWDIDRIDEAVSGLRLMSRNRFNVLAIHDRDHGSGAPGGLRSWAETLLQSAGITLDGGRIRLLAFPRLFGFAFNPISMWYCEHRDGTLRAVIAEVRNTFGEKHCYLLASGGEPMPYQRAAREGQMLSRVAVLRSGGPLPLHAGRSRRASQSGDTRDAGRRADSRCDAGR